MNVKERTDRLFGKKKSDDKIVDGCVSLMKYFGWSYEELMCVPLSAYLVIIESVNRLEKEAEVKSKRKQR